MGVINILESDEKFMKLALSLAEKGRGYVNPNPLVGAVIVKDGKVIATGHNEVICSHDPTAHAEMVAIRKASKVLERFDL